MLRRLVPRVFEENLKAETILETQLKVDSEPCWQDEKD